MISHCHESMLYVCACDLHALMLTGCVSAGSSDKSSEGLWTRQPLHPACQRTSCGGLVRASSAGACINAHAIHLLRFGKLLVFQQLKSKRALTLGLHAIVHQIYVW